MVCKFCGAEIPEPVKFCPECGQAMGDDAQPQKKAKKKKKPLYKRVWFWLLVAFLVFLALPSGDGGSSSTVPEPTVSESDYRASCGEINYKDLARNPDAKKGNHYKFTGEVVQVQESGKRVYLRINVTPVYFDDDNPGDPMYWEDTIYCEATLPENGNRILEDDIITVYGTCAGLHKYTSVLGSQVALPELDVKYWDVNN